MTACDHCLRCTCILRDEYSAATGQPITERERAENILTEQRLKEGQ